jgi:hypothetical protein
MPIEALRDLSTPGPLPHGPRSLSANKRTNNGTSGGYLAPWTAIRSLVPGTNPQSGNETRRSSLAPAPRGTKDTPSAQIPFLSHHPCHESQPLPWSASRLPESYNIDNIDGWSRRREGHAIFTRLAILPWCDAALLLFLFRPRMRVTLASE